MGFIYKVTNNINGKVYIGKTVETVEQRWKEHLLMQRRSVAKDRTFYKALKKYGVSNFSLETLEEVNNSEQLNEREKYWIQYYHSYVGEKPCRGYNETKGGDGTLKYNYDLLCADYLKTHSYSQTARNMNCHMTTVRNACKCNHIDLPNKFAGRSINMLDDDRNVIDSFKSIRKAAEFICLFQNRNLQTVRKRLTYLVNHRQNQKAYGYYWEIS